MSIREFLNKYFLYFLLPIIAGILILFGYFIGVHESNYNRANGIHTVTSDIIFTSDSHGGERR